MKKMVLLLFVLVATTHLCQAKEETWGEWFSNGLTWVKDTVTAPFACKKECCKETCKKNACAGKETHKHDCCDKVKKLVHEDLVDDEVSGESIYE